MSLEIKTCQPFKFGCLTSTLTLEQLQVDFPTATKLVYLGNVYYDIAQESVYVYAVWAGDEVTIPSTPHVSGNSIVCNVQIFGNSTQILDGGQNFPTQFIESIVEYSH